MKKLWNQVDKDGFRRSKKKTLAGMMKKLLKLVLPKPNDIRMGPWRSMSVMSKASLSYAALDAHAARILYYHLLSTISDKGWC